MFGPDAIVCTTGIARACVDTRAIRGGCRLAYPPTRAATVHGSICRLQTPVCLQAPVGYQPLVPRRGSRTD